MASVLDFCSRFETWKKSTRKCFCGPQSTQVWPHLVLNTNDRDISFFLFLSENSVQPQVRHCAYTQNFLNVFLLYEVTSKNICIIVPHFLPWKRQTNKQQQNKLTNSENWKQMDFSPKLFGHFPLLSLYSAFSLICGIPSDNLEF